MADSYNDRLKARGYGHLIIEDDTNLIDLSNMPQDENVETEYTPDKDDNTAVNIATPLNETGEYEDSARARRPVPGVNYKALERFKKIEGEYSKLLALEERPVGAVQALYDLLASEVPSQREASYARARESGDLVLQIMQQANPDTKFGRFENGDLWLIDKDDVTQTKRRLDFSVSDQIWNEKFRTTGAIGGAYLGMRGALAGSQDPKNKIRGKLRNAAEWAAPGGAASKAAKGVAWLLNNVITPGLAGMGLSAVGGGLGQTGDDLYNSLVLDQAVNQHRLLDRAIEATKAEAIDGVALGTAGLGIKAAFNKIIGRWALTGSAGVLAVADPATFAGTGVVLELLPAGTKMFDSPLVKKIAKDMEWDLEDPVVRQQILDATAEFRRKAKDMTPRDLEQLYGAKASADLSGMVQTDSFANAVRQPPNALGKAEQERIFRDQFGKTQQGKVNAQLRLNQIKEQYPKGKDMPPEVASERAMLEAGLYATPMINGILKGLTDPRFWDDSVDKGDFMDSRFIAKVLEYTEGWQVHKWKLPKGASTEDTKVFPPSIALGLRGTVAGKPSPGAKGVVLGANKTIRQRRNAMTFLEQRSNELGKALHSEQLMAFDNTGFQQIERMTNSGYNASLTAAKSYTSDETYRVLASDGVSVDTYNKALQEAADHSGPSADAVKRLARLIDPLDKEYTAKELMDTASWIREFMQTKEFNKELLPHGQKLFTDAYTTIEQRIASDLGKTPEGRRALRVHKVFNERRKRLNAVKTNRVFASLQERIKQLGIKGNPTEEQILELNKIVDAHAFSADNKQLTLLLQKLPKPISKSMSNHIFNKAWSRNTFRTEDGFEFIDSEALLNDLAGFRNSKQPWIKTRMNMLQEFHDVLGGGKQVAITKPGQGPVHLIRRAIGGAGKGGLGTNPTERYKVMVASTQVGLVREIAFEKIGWAQAQFGKLFQASAKFFENPLNAQASIQMQLKLRELAKQARKVGADDYAAEVDKLEELYNRLKDVAYHDSRGPSTVDPASKRR